jgi:hypothetical protein
MCVHPNGETTLLPGGNGDEGGGRSRPLNESPPAGRSRARGGSRGREQKKIGLLSFGTIFLCRGALLDPAKKGGREGVGAQRQNARARGMGGAPLGRVPCAEVKGRAGCRAGAGRGSPGFARRAKREAPAHTREGLWLAEGPGRALGQGLTNHQPACQGEGRVGGKTPAARRTAVHRMPESSQDAVSENRCSDGGSPSGLEPRLSFAQEGRFDSAAQLGCFSQRRKVMRALGTAKTRWTACLPGRAGARKSPEGLPQAILENRFGG